MEFVLSKTIETPVADLFEKIMHDYPTDESAYQVLENSRWKMNRMCPHCNARNWGKRYANFQYHCSKCRKRYSVLTNTYLHNTRLPIQKWFLAFMVVRGPRLFIGDYSSIGRDLDVRYETAFILVHKIKRMVIEHKVKIGQFDDVLRIMIPIAVKVQGEDIKKTATPILR